MVTWLMSSGLKPSWVCSEPRSEPQIGDCASVTHSPSSPAEKKKLRSGRETTLSVRTDARQHRPQPELVLAPVDTQQPVVAEVEGRRRLPDEAGRTRSAEGPAVVA